MKKVKRFTLISICIFYVFAAPIVAYIQYFHEGTEGLVHTPSKDYAKVVYKMK